MSQELFEKIRSMRTDHRLLDEDRSRITASFKEMLSPVSKWLQDKYDSKIVEYPIADESFGGRHTGRLSVWYEHKDQLVGVRLSFSPGSNSGEFSYARRLCEHVEEIPQVHDVLKFANESANQLGLGCKTHATYFNAVKPIVLSVGADYTPESLATSLHMAQSLGTFLDQQNTLNNVQQ